jgi:hypothetical protein
VDSISRLLTAQRGAMMAEDSAPKDILHGSVANHYSVT